MATFGYLQFIRVYLQKKFDKYELLGIEQDVYLNNSRQFYFIATGGFLAGIIGGILGLGTASCIMVFLLMTPINITSATATSGYQVLFVGLASLI